MLIYAGLARLELRVRVRVRISIKPVQHTGRSTRSSLWRSLPGMSACGRCYVHMKAKTGLYCGKWGFQLAFSPYLTPL